MYQVIISEPAKKFIRLLQKSSLKKVFGAIENLATNPRPAGCKKLIGSSIYRIRVGDYRILYAIDDKVKIVDVRKVGHRKDVYE